MRAAICLTVLAALSQLSGAPGPEPRVVVDRGQAVRVFALAESPDGRVRVFTREDESGLHLVESRLVAGVWSEPQRPVFAVADAAEADPFFAPATGVLYFMSLRSGQGRGEGRTDYDIWSVAPDGEGWAEPRRLSEDVNTTDAEIYPSVDRQGVLYFASRRPGGSGGNDIYRAVPGGSGWAVETLGAPINTAASDSNPAIRPDGRALVFFSAGHGGLGGVDLFVSQRTANGWSPPRNLGGAINTAGNDFAPGYSGDGRQLFFGRDDRIFSYPIAHLSPLER